VPIEGGQVADWINGLRSTPGIRWLDVPDWSVRSSENERAASDLVDRLRATADALGIPFEGTHLGAGGLLDRLTGECAEVSFQELPAGEVLDEEDASAFLRRAQPLFPRQRVS
jgi:hypothetical protein